MMVYVYILFELLNIAWVSKFGFKTHYYQPHNYLKYRVLLAILKYISVIILGISSVTDRNFLLLLFFLIIPILIDFSLFKYCFFVEKKRLIEFCMNHNPDINKREAMSTALEMIEEGFKNHEYIF